MPSEVDAGTEGVAAAPVARRPGRLARLVGRARRLLLLHVRTLVPRRATLAAGLTAVTACAAVVTALASADSAITGSVARFEQAVSQGAQLVVVARSGTGLDAAQLSGIGRQTGVSATEQLLVAPVQVGKTAALLVGVAGDLDRFAAVRSVAPLTRATVVALLAGRVVVGPGLSPPTAHQVFTPTGLHRIHPVPGPSVGATAAVDGGRSLLAALPEAEALTGHGPTSVLVRVRAGTPVAGVAARLRSLLGGAADVDRPATLVGLATASVADVLAAFPVVELVVTLVAVVVAVTTMAAVARDAVRHVATLRLVGARQSQARTGVLLVGLGVGLVGVGLGLPLGALAGRWLLDRLPSFVLASLPVTVTYRVPVSAAASGAVAALGAALAAAWLGSRVLQGVAPAEAVRPTVTGTVDDRAPRPRPTLLAVSAVALGGLLLLTWRRPDTASVPAAALLVGAAGAVVVGLLPLLWRLATTGTGRLSRSGAVTAAALRRSSGRFAVAVTGVTAAVAVLLGVGEIAGDGAATASATFHSLAAPILWVGLGSAATVVPNGLPMGAGFLRAVESTPGVAAVRAGQFDTVQMGGREILLEGLVAGSATPLVAQAPPGAQRQLAEGTGAVVSTQVAQAFHLRTGQRLRLATPTGPRWLRVAAVDTVFVWPQGTIGFALPELQRWFHSPGSSWFEVVPRRGVPLGQLRGAVLATARRAGLRVTVLTGAQEIAGARSVVSALTRLLDGVEALCLVGVAATTFTTLAVAVTQRRRELGVLRAVGASARVVRRSVVLEGLAVGAAGVVLGVPTGLLVELVGLRVEAQAQGLPLAWSVAGGPVVLAIAAPLAMVVLGSALPAWRASRQTVAALVSRE